jgi:hypothetical protein
MTIAIYGTLAAVTALFFAACLTLTPTFGAPAGHHHKPPLRRRLRERSQRERARDQETERLFAGMEVPPEIARDTGWESLNAEQARARGWDQVDGGPLMPLPPEVTAHADEVLSRLPVGTLESVSDQVCTQCGERWGERWGDDPECECACTRGPAEPEDPHGVATPGDQADAYVGGVRHDPEMDYRDETGTWPALMAEVAAEVTQ